MPPQVPRVEPADGEREAILGWVVQGVENEAVAPPLNYCVYTVANRLCSLCAKLHVVSINKHRTSRVLWAGFEAGLL